MRSICDSWESPWGFNADEPVPVKQELFPAPDFKGVSTWAMEDFLQHNGVFVHGVRGNSCHSDSYMTVMSYDRANKCVDLLQETFSPTPEEWKILTDAWLSNPNMQPPLRLFALLVCRRFNISAAQVDPAKWK
jgi:hypothetical protein